ncbi:SPOR domain-containing protein [Anaerophaga thermohalophila]|jgi:cell division septation protein DedD|uniref:SPOR domain-containing protein n=1 Tax=Anaerophaga thermohalophila TaxID=177400 RepID=UPI00030CAC7D|nr:SPOR domain-containing protein [Anaerophaga thermohalophila]
MEQYLLELIKNNNRVIVPNFGAFIVSRDAGTTVLFNNFLSFNDGLLINHVSKKEGVDTNEATQRVSDFVDKIKQELDLQGEYTIEKLGSFTKDQNGILRFTQDPGVASLIPDEKTEEPEKEEDSGLLDIDSEASSGEAAPDDEKKEEASEKKKDTAARKDKKLLNLEEKKEETEIKSSKSAASEKSTSSEKEKIATSGGGTTTTHDDTVIEGRRGWPWWLIMLIILIPVALVLVYFLFIRDREAQEETKVPVETEVVDTIAKKPGVDSAAIKKQQEEVLRKEQADKEGEAEKKEKVKSGPRHHIIVGSFEHEKNADDLVKKLKDKGYQNAFVFKRNNLFMVSAASYESLIDAREAQEMFVQKEKMENWILTRR